MTRLERIAFAMGLTPGGTGLLLAVNTRHDRWDLMGCVDGPVALPKTKKAMTFKQVLEVVEEELKEELAEADAARREA